MKAYEVVSWNAIAASSGTPKDIMDAMNKAMHEVLAMPDDKAKFEAVGVEPHASTPTNCRPGLNRTSTNGTRSSFRKNSRARLLIGLAAWRPRRFCPENCHPACRLGGTLPPRTKNPGFALARTLLMSV